MTHKARHCLWVLVLWCLCETPTGAREYWNFKTAYDAYDQGEFQLAADIYKRLADKGDPRAQNELGFLYSVGQGVPQDFKIAAAWYLQAADQGYPPALLHLAGLFESGRGVQKNLIEAHKYFSLTVLLTRKNSHRQIASSRLAALTAAFAADQLIDARKRACRWWHAHRHRLGEDARAPTHCKSPKRPSAPSEHFSGPDELGKK